MLQAFVSLQVPSEDRTWRHLPGFFTGVTGFRPQLQPCHFDPCFGSWVGEHPTLASVAPGSTRPAGSFHDRRDVVVVVRSVRAAP